MNKTEIELIKPIKPVGGYYLGGKYGVGFLFNEKPNRFHRLMVKLILGWEWIDEKK